MYEHGRRLHMHALVVMPDHVHLLLTILANENGVESPFYEILHDIKSASAHKINKVLEGRPHIVDAITNGEVQLVFNTTEGATALADSRSLRRAALLHKVPYYTTLSGAVAAAQGIKAYLAGDFEVRALQSYFGDKAASGVTGPAA